MPTMWANPFLGFPLIRDTALVKVLSDGAYPLYSRRDRPEIRQYFLESEKDGTPFSRDKRAIVYQRAKRALDKRPFGTQNDVYAGVMSGCIIQLRQTLRKNHFALPLAGPIAVGPIRRRSSTFRR
jgi:hypothetical protein